MSLAAVIQHLQVLQDSGVVRSTKVGRIRTCRLVPAELRAAEDWLHRQRTTWEQRLDRLGDVLSDAPDHDEGATP
jgi:DNA-binding transcriptional ArsR family regulator